MSASGTVCLNGCAGWLGGENPNRPNGPWRRCYQCGGLWDKDDNDLLATMPELVKPKGSFYNRYADGTYDRD